MTELSAAQKSLLHVESVLESSENQRSALKEEAMILTEKLRVSQIDELDAKEVSEALRAEHDRLDTENQAFKIQIAKLESAMEVKNELINHMMPSETQTNSPERGHNKKEVWFSNEYNQLGHFWRIFPESLPTLEFISRAKAEEKRRSLENSGSQS